MISSPQFADGISASLPNFIFSAIVDSTEDAIISKDLSGTIIFWNRSAERIFGYTEQEILGKSIELLLPPGRLPEERSIIARIKRGERIEHFETVRRRKDGRLIDVSVTISPLRAQDGTIIGASKIAREITDQKEAQRAGLLLAAIVTSSDDAIISKSLDGIITSWNDGAHRLFGYTEAEAIGRAVLMLVPSDRQDEEPKILARLRRGERVEHFETVRVRKNGEQIHVSLTISPIKDANGVIIGASKIARDISEIKRLSAEREQLLQSERAARAEAERANRSKDDFLATISHELRTPLNAIVGWTEVLKSSPGATAEILEAAAVIERNAQAQAQLIEDLLDLGRIASGKLVFEMLPVELKPLLLEAIESLRQTADSKGIAIATNLDCGRAAVTGDRRRLQQVLANLLTNAMKFTPAGGRVLISAQTLTGEIEIFLQDTGCGIAPDFLPHVFDRFSQADSSITRQYGGLGIGLALVKQLVEAHGGRVRAESAGVGQGAKFSVFLPVKSAPPAAVAEPNEAGAKSPREHDLEGVRILMVDDDKDSLAVLRRVFTARKAVVQTSTSAEEALAAFAGFHPDIILSDIGMPVQDGYELIRKIRLLPEGGRVPAIALTALARPEDQSRALEAGFQAHLSKPLAFMDVVLQIKRLLELGTV